MMTSPYFPGFFLDKFTIHYSLSTTSEVPRVIVRTLHAIVASSPIS
jgi:hypothetical protein